MWCDDSDDHDCGEPVVTLLDGHVVLLGVFRLVRSLLASGHTITITLGGEVEITPPVSEDTWWILESNRGDTEAVLDAEDTTLMLPRNPAETVH